MVPERYSKLVTGGGCRHSLGDFATGDSLRRKSALRADAGTASHSGRGSRSPSESVVERWTGSSPANDANGNSRISRFSGSDASLRNLGCFFAEARSRNSICRDGVCPVMANRCPESRISAIGSAVVVGEGVVALSVAVEKSLPRHVEPSGWVEPGNLKQNGVRP